MVGLLATTALFLGNPTPATAVEPRAIDAIFAAWDKPASAGCALAVIQDGKIVYEHGYGSADLEHDTPITPSTLFYVGSVSKQFTAAAIALMAERGQISLDDDVRKYVPEVPDFGHRITIRHLIHHTSGLRDYLALRDLAGEAADGVFGDDEVLALLSRQKALNFTPGAEHLYSNSGYFLLSVIVKRASGKSLREFAAENIFRPLVMGTAQFRDDHAMLIKNRARGYAGRSGAFRASEPNFDVVGAGGLFMSVRDFLPWDQNFHDAKLGGAGFIDRLQTPGTLNDGSPLSYAFGLTVGTYRGQKVVEHSGAYGGFRAHVLRFPAQRLSVACFCNLASMEPGRLARQVADLLIEKATSGETRPVLAPKQADAGVRPVAGAAPASPAVRPAVDVAVEKRLDYVGEYFSEELQTLYRVRVDAGKFILHGGRRGALVMQSVGNEMFEAGGRELRFVRDGTGRIDALLVTAGRVRNLRFQRR